MSPAAPPGSGPSCTGWTKSVQNDPEHGRCRDILLRRPSGRPVFGSGPWPPWGQADCIGAFVHPNPRPVSPSTDFPKLGRWEAFNPARDQAYGGWVGLTGGKPTLPEKIPSTLFFGRRPDMPNSWRKIFPENDPGPFGQGPTPGGRILAGRWKTRPIISWVALGFGRQRGPNWREGPSCRGKIVGLKRQRGGLAGKDVPLRPPFCGPAKDYESLCELDVELRRIMQHPASIPQKSVRGGFFWAPGPASDSGPLCNACASVKTATALPERPFTPTFRTGKPAAHRSRSRWRGAGKKLAWWLCPRKRHRFFSPAPVRLFAVSTPAFRRLGAMPRPRIPGGRKKFPASCWDAAKKGRESWPNRNGGPLAQFLVWRPALPASPCAGSNQLPLSGESGPVPPSPSRPSVGRPRS